MLLVKTVRPILLISALIVILAAAIGAAMWFSKPAPVGALDNFAQCLNKKGAVMYGAEWCPHCQNEKRAFGNSFRYVNYVECPADPKRCIAAGITGYPTWIFPDGRKFLGEQGLEKLSQESGCTLSESKL